jgi:hypothetical protein
MRASQASSTAGKKRQVIVIGGGLAGMTVAKELAKRKLAVTILEAGPELGGKAGSVKRGEEWEDHAYHIFPGWYANVRALLREIGCAQNLVDLSVFHTLRQHEFPRLVSIHQASSPWNMLRNLFNGALPLHQNLLAYYFIIDLAASSFDDRAYLDRVSSAGFLRSRFYGIDAAAQSLHQSALQGSSIPLYDLSAMTLRKVVRLWAMHPSPLVSVLDGPMQETFIDPFRSYLDKLGVQIHPNQAVQRLRVNAGRVDGVEMAGGAPCPIAVSPDDAIVLAVPPEVVLRLVDADLIETEMARPRPAHDDRVGLADLGRLRSAPMAALHLDLKRRIPGIPAEPVFLDGSRFGTSFLDVAPHWGLEQTRLHLIAANYEPLRCLLPEEARELIIEELLDYVPAIERRDLPDDGGFLQPHVEQPLFLNTVAAWHYRPEATTGVRNLFVAGDYCRTQADLTTMEGAVMSGLNTAGAILKYLGRRARNVRARPLAEPPWLALQLARYAALPLILPLALWNRAGAGLSALYERATERAFSNHP